MKKINVFYGEKINHLQNRAIEILSDRCFDKTGEYPNIFRYNDKNSDTQGINIYIGTRDNNPFIKNAFENELCHSEEYRIKVINEAVFIEGYDDIGVLYGCIDFFDKYIVKCEYPNDNGDKLYQNSFEKELPNIEFSSRPSINMRGIWSWGHVIYDYEAFIDNMQRLKLNALTIWNDNVPTNMQEIIEYAHKNGVKIFLGYSWLWDVRCKDMPFDRLCDFSDGIFMQYEREYAHLDIDGIYFQSATEMKSSYINGICVAQAITDFVNHTAKAFFEKYPSIELQFGLHATSVKNHLEFIKNIDKRIRIVWEDCGAFPFSYIPADVTNYNETKKFVEEIAVLRSEDDKFGAVIKGMTKLDWATFTHLEKPQPIGVDPENVKKEKYCEKKKIWRYLTAYWLKNAAFAADMIRAIRKIKGENTIISALIEDGAFEEKIVYPAALFAELLWDTSSDIDEIKTNVALRDYVEFA